MFKHNYLQKLAFDNIRKQKKFYKFIFISLVMVFVLSTIISILFASYEDIGYRERYQRYGIWSAVVKNSNDAVIQQLKADDMDVGYVYDLGDIRYQGQKVGVMSSLDHTAQKLAKLNLIDGRMPVQQDEIILEEDQFVNLGIPQKINQTLELTTHYQDQELTKEYKIVGIVSNYTQIYTTTLGNIITTQITSPQYDALLYSQDNLNLWNKIIDKELETEVELNIKTYNYYLNLNHRYDEGDYTKILRRLIIFIGFVGVLGTMVSAMTKRTENFVLMRAIGATSKQIQKMVVYEGIILIFIALLVGLSIAILLSVIVLYTYHQLMNAPFIFMINKTFYIQFSLSLLTSLIGIFIPSFQAYFVPLSGKIQQKAKKHRVRSIRKNNILSLSFKEFMDHKILSFLLVAIIFVGIMIGDLMSLSVESYKDTNRSMNEEDDFDYILENNSAEFSQTELNNLSHLSGVESQIIHSQEIYATWPGIENEKSMISHRKLNDSLLLNDDSPLYQRMSIYYYENENMVKEVLNNNGIIGRFPENDNEILVVKPCVQVHEGGYGTSLEHSQCENSVQDEDLKVGNTLSISYTDEYNEVVDKTIDTEFKIVGVIEFDNVIRKEERLFDYSFTAITNASTYQKYFENQKQLCYFDIDDQSAMFPLKKELFEMKKKYPDSYYQDTYTELQLQHIQNVEMILKDCSFFFIFLTGTMVLTYLQRKIKVLSLKSEIGLYRAIGMTKKQLYFIHLFYGIIIYLLAVILYLSFYISNLAMANLNYDEIISTVFSPINSMVLVALGICFIATIYFPIRSQLKENLLSSISS